MSEQINCCSQLIKFPGGAKHFSLDKFNFAKTSNHACLKEENEAVLPLPTQRKSFLPNGAWSYNKSQTHLAHVRHGRIDLSAAADHAIVENHQLDQKNAKVINREIKTVAQSTDEGGALDPKHEVHLEQEQTRLDIDPLWLSEICKKCYQSWPSNARQQGKLLSLQNTVRTPFLDRSAFQGPLLRNALPQISISEEKHLISFKSKVL